MKKIMLIGPQGSGKTTQAKIIAEKLGIKYLGTGEIFRKIIENKEPGYEKLLVIQNGNLVDDETTCNFVRGKLNSPEYQNGFVVDGYPRNIAQKNIFDPDFDIVLYIRITDETATKRLIARGRSDDTKEAIQKRLELYHQETGPLLDVFLNEGKLWVVDGEKPVETVTEQIFNHLNKTA
jgi:adenylate kinase